MADSRRIYTDMTELMLMYLDGNEYKTATINRDQIIRIQLDEFKERKFIIRVPSERIQIITKKLSKPIVYTKLREKKHFDEYKSMLEKYAKENYVTFINNIGKNKV